MNRRIIGILTSVLLAGSTIGTGAPAPKPKRPLSAYYGFRPMEIFKLDWRIRNLRVCDLNGDGLSDLVVVNNSKARIELLVQRRTPGPKTDSAKEDVNELESDWRFKRRGLVTEKDIYSLDVGDLDSDGRPDLVFYGSPPELVVLYQDKGGEFSRRRGFAIRDGMRVARAVVVGDVNADKRDDVVLLGEDDTYILLQSADHTLQQARRLPNSASGIGRIDLADMNGDGRLDLVYLTHESETPLRVRCQDAQGELGPERRLRMTQPRTLCLADVNGKPGAEVLTVEAKSGRVTVMELRAVEPGESPPTSEVYVFPLPGGVKTKDRELAVADVDGDRRPDVVVSDPAGAQILLFTQRPKTGLGPPRAFPALVGVRTVRAADTDGDGKAEVVVLSSEEKMIGLSRFAKGRLSFPAAVPIEGTPHAMDLADLDGDRRADLAYVLSTKDPKKGNTRYRLGIGRWDPKGRFTPTGPAVDLPRFGAHPTGLHALDANHDGRMDLLVQIPYEDPRLILQRPGGKWEPVGQKRADRRGMLKGLAPGAVSLCDLEGDGKIEVLVASRNFARSIRYNSSGQWEIVDQFNGPHPKSRIVGVTALDADRDGTKELVLLDKKDHTLNFLKRGKDRLYHPWKRREIGPFDFRAMKVVDLNGDGRDDLLVAGTNSFGVVYVGKPDPELRVLARYETKIKDGRYALMAVGDVNSDAKRDLVLLEVAHHFVDVVAIDRPDRLVHAMQFRVFEQKTYRSRRSEEGSPEPREMAIGDLTGDGKNDLVIIVHDRVILYPQD